MSSEPQTEAGQEVEDRPRLAAVEIGEWPGLGGTVGFDVGERITVLVGKNGAGKSLIMEGLKAAGDSILFGTEVTSSPNYFVCEISDSLQAFFYRYKIEIEEISEMASEDTEPPTEQFSWTESCRRKGKRKDLWFVENAQLRVHGRPPQPFIPNQGLVSRALIAKPEINDMPQEATALAELFQGLSLISAGIPRDVERRQEVLLRRNAIIDKHGTRFFLWKPINEAAPRISQLATTILRMKSSRYGRFAEFVDILNQLGLVRDVSIRQFNDRARKNAAYASVEFDGDNLGFCSDGTQRVAQIIVELLRHQNRCLLIEEPETAVHPSLLARLLSILESYSHDRQIIIATHSPQIVDWCKPEDLRLVERIEEKTRVRKLDEKELGRIHNYLAHDGTLSDYVYRQSSE